MSELHSVGVSEETRALAEKVGPEFLENGLLQARDKSWEVLHEIRKGLKEGMTERDAFHYALSVFAEHGVEKHWHKPYIRFGPGTLLSFHDSLQKEYRLQKNDAYYVDLGPVWKDAVTGIEYEGDVGDTFVFGENAEAEKCAADARKLFRLAQEKWKAEKLSGIELYSWLETEAKALGYELKEKVDGHRLSDYPHNKYSKERLALTSFCPQPGRWVFEVQLLKPEHQLGAFFEDLL